MVDFKGCGASFVICNVTRVPARSASSSSLKFVARCISHVAILHLVRRARRRGEPETCAAPDAQRPAACAAIARILASRFYGVDAADTGAGIERHGLEISRHRAKLQIPAEEVNRPPLLVAVSLPKGSPRLPRVTLLASTRTFAPRGQLR